MSRGHPVSGSLGAGVASMMFASTRSPWWSPHGTTRFDRLKGLAVLVDPGNRRDVRSWDRRHLGARCGAEDGWSTLEQPHGDAPSAHCLDLAVCAVGVHQDHRHDAQVTEDLTQPSRVGPQGLGPELLAGAALTEQVAPLLTAVLRGFHDAGSQRGDRDEPVEKACLAVRSSGTPGLWPTAPDHVDRSTDSTVKMTTQAGSLAVRLGTRPIIELPSLVTGDAQAAPI